MCWQLQIGDRDSHFISYQENRYVNLSFILSHDVASGSDIIQLLTYDEVDMECY